MILDNYIIRIYRREKTDPRLIVGIVELVGTKEKQGFNSFDELREILGSASGQPARRRRGENGRKEGRGRKAGTSRKRAAERRA